MTAHLYGALQEIEAEYAFYVIVYVMMIFQQIGNCRIQVAVFAFG